VAVEPFRWSQREPDLLPGKAHDGGFHQTRPASGYRTGALCATADGPSHDHRQDSAPSVEDGIPSRPQAIRVAEDQQTSHLGSKRRTAKPSILRASVHGSTAGAAQYSPVPTDRRLRGYDVPSLLVPLEAASPVGAGQSTSRMLQRPSGARRSRAREHPPSTQNPTSSSSACRLWTLSPSRKAAKTVEPEIGARQRRSLPAACHMTSANPDPRSPIDYRRSSGDCLRTAGGVWCHRLPNSRTLSPLATSSSSGCNPCREAF
jgi:hypothetical protein